MNNKCFFKNYNARENILDYTTTKYRHNERCAECKKNIFQFLSQIYSKTNVNYNLNLPCQLEDYQGYKSFDVLESIYKQLQNYRGFSQFVRAKKLSNVDYFIEDPGIIIEFDESQHFTKPREVTLKKYPEDLKLGYNKDIWINRCIQLDRKDNDPPYRDEQRAWYDTLRDFSSMYRNIRIIRILPEECVWCKLIVTNETDIQWFKDFIDQKLKLYT